MRLSSYLTSSPTPLKSLNGPSTTRTILPASNSTFGRGFSTPSCTQSRIAAASSSRIGSGLSAVPDEAHHLRRLADQVPAFVVDARDPALVVGDDLHQHVAGARSEEHKSELQSLMRLSYAVFCLKIQHKN